METKAKFSTKQIAYIAIFVALGVVINTLRFGILSFGGLPIILSGYALGPILGFIVGAITDVVAFIIRPSNIGFPNPIFTLTSALTGLIPVVVSSFLGDKYPNFKLKNIFIGVLIGQFITTVFISTYFVDKLFLPGSFWIKMPIAAKKQLIQAPVYAYIIKVIIDRTHKLINYRNL